MQRSQSFIIILLLTFAAKTFAHTPKEGNVWAVAGPFISRTQFTGATGGQTPFLGGLALIANGDISEVGSLEIGIFHMNKIFYREEGAGYLGESTEMMYITMGYRRWFNADFSAAAALYSSYTMGSTRIVHSDFATGSEPTTSAQDITDYGLDFSFQAELFNDQKVAVVLDSRYSYCLTPKENEKADHYGFLIGFKYFIQEKQVREKRPGS